MSDCDGTAPFFLADSDMSASLRSDFAFHKTPPILVRTVSLDSYLRARALSGRTVIKVDVEGAEDAFFRGARHTIATHRPDIVAEVATSAAPQYTEMLGDLGYRWYPITDQGLVPVQELQPTVRGNLLFLNYLFSARPPEDLAALFERIRPAIRKIDLSQTSKFVDQDHIHRAVYGSTGAALCSAFAMFSA